MKWIALVVLLAACGKHKDKPVDQEAAKALFDEVPLTVPPGMSDLSVDDHGTLWAISERDRKVVEIHLGPPPTVITHPLEGVPDGLDTEALAWLGDGSFALGYEGAHTPVAGILFAQLKDGKVVIDRSRSFTASELGVEPTINHGIEAVCGRPDQVLAAAEVVGTDTDGTRWASLLRVSGDTIIGTRLHLTTKTGKISAMHCTMDADGTAHVVAIERHYGECRILSFDVSPQATTITPKVEYDLAPVIGDSFNLEGIARLPDGRLVLINDNQGREAKGATKLLVFHPR
jgi:hypothetical protein